MNIKMGIFRFFSLKPFKFKEDNIKTILQKDNKASFLNWFSGFTDAEGNFLISSNLNYFRFRFKITMHIDNLEALNTIKTKLKIGNVIVEKNRNRCSFVVQSFTEIRDVILSPLCNKTFEPSRKALIAYSNQRLLFLQRFYSSQNLIKLDP
jgi:hypothetical protein